MHEQNYDIIKNKFFRFLIFFLLFLQPHIFV